MGNSSKKRTGCGSGKAVRGFHLKKGGIRMGNPKGWVRGVCMAIIAGGLAACGTVRIPVMVTHPAEINMVPYKQVAMGQVDGNLGRAFSDGLKNHLVESGRFQVVDRSRLDQIMRELNLSMSDLTDEGNRARLGKLLTASAMITGHAEGGYNEELTKKASTCYSGETEVPCTIYYRTGVFKTSGSVDVIDVQTGQIIKSKLLTNKCEETKSATNGVPEVIDKDALGGQCVSTNILVFYKAISPWNETVQVPFQTDKTIPELETGVNKMKIGETAQAIELFAGAAKNAEGNPGVKPKAIAAAYWNLGLAYEYTDEFEKAIEAFKKGHSFNAASQYLDEIRNVERRRGEKRRLVEQGM